MSKKVISNKKMMSGVSFFSGAGIGETYLNEAGIDIIVANELLENRAALNAHTHKGTKVISGDILDDDIFNQVCDAMGNKADFLIASPPCQGMSIAGKNRKHGDLSSDSRNYLVMRVVDAIKRLDPDFVLIENVPTFLKTRLNYCGGQYTLLEILEDIFGKEYMIDAQVMNSADFGVPQTRLRAIIKMNKKGTTWDWPQKQEKKITVRDAIGDLPSLESGEKSAINWHYARNHSADNIEWMRHTPTGESAFNNSVHYPKKKTGERVKGYESSYRRIRWDEPAPTITMRNDCIASQRNVHPGRELKDGTYSDARALSLRELFILTSLPADWDIPPKTPETLIRHCIGEAIPPKLVKAIAEGIKR